MVLPWEGNGITIRLVILLPTKKFFGNPISLCNKQEDKNQNANLENETPIYSDKTPFQKNKTAFCNERNAVLQKDFGNYGFVFGGVFAVASANGEGCFFSADGFRAVYIDYSYYRSVFFGEDFDLS